ncbi:MAG TPA: glycoside hydrolase domain-containing protein [Myxococcaceae bacterium]|nr:glycoside hydrolase domain-containing protein [Myxococcaceae bacterium]
MQAHLPGNTLPTHMVPSLSSRALTLAVLAGLCLGMAGCKTKKSPEQELRPVDSPQPTPTAPSAPPPPPPPTTPPPPPGSPNAFALSAMFKLRPEAKPPVDVPLDAPSTARGISLTAARNEFVSFQVAIHGGAKGAHDVSVALDQELQGPARIGGADVTLYREDFLRVEIPSFQRADEIGRWPDALVPDVDEIAREKRNAFPFSVNPNETRAVWVDIHVPIDAPPGQYAGVLRAKASADGLEPSTTKVEYLIPVSLTVLEPVMPSTPRLPTAYFFWAPEMCQAYGVPCAKLLEDPAKSILQGFLKMGLEHRISISTAFKVYEDPNDWTAFDAAYGPFLDGTANTRLPGAQLTTVQYTGDRVESGYIAFAEHFKARGWFARAYDYIADEPPRTASLEETRKRAALAKHATQLAPDRSDPPIRTMITTMYWQGQEMFEQIDVLGAMVTRVDSPEEPYAQQRPNWDSFATHRPGRSVWLYQSCSSHGCRARDLKKENVPGAGWPSIMVDASAAKNRSLEWLTYRLGFGGELYYETVLHLKDAWTTLFNFGGNGDGTLFYPGTPDRIGGKTPVPVASMRLKYTRMGIQDYEWLKWTEAVDPKCAQEVALSVVPASYLVPDDGTLFDKGRDRLIACYLKAKK